MEMLLRAMSKMGLTRLQGVLLDLIGVDRSPAGYYRAEGMIKNVNTIEEYRNMDKSQMIVQAGKTVRRTNQSSGTVSDTHRLITVQTWDAINDGTIYSCPSLLSSFIILSFADLKNYKFYYWFGFPAIHSDPSWTPVESTGSQGENADTPRGEHLSSHDSSTLVEAVQTWSYGLDGRQRGFFLARKRRNPLRDSAHSDWQIASLSEYENGFFTGVTPEDCYVCFADPSNYENAPGWMLRNLLIVVKQRWGLDQVQILRYRDVQSKRDQGRSIVIRLRSTQGPASDTTKLQQAPGQLPKITGWERNPASKLAGRIVNLTDYMDPTRYSGSRLEIQVVDY